jgi:hyaluronoglucosaminidase
MPGDLDQLAGIQAEIVADVCSWFPQARVLICPTYYSFDPVLEKFFGTRPANYWRDLGAALPEAVEIFWTGNLVCSESIEAEDIDAISRQLNRQVVLWDNYPVNDGAVRSNYLYSEKLPRRDVRIKDKIAGHFCNPMNQPLLSLTALQGLAELHGTAAFADDSWLQEVYGGDSFRQLQRDKHDFQTLGLTGLGENRRRELTKLYSALPGDAAAEVAAWLLGEYTFDPACLTD